MVAVSTKVVPVGIDTTYGLTDQKVHSNIMALSAEGAVKNVMLFTATVDVADLVDAAGSTVQITGCNGVALGDIVLGVSLGVDIQDFTVTAYIQAAGVIELRAQNESGAQTNLASTTVRVLVADVT